MYTLHFNAVDADINNHSSGFNPIALHKLGLADGCDDDISTATHSRNILREFYFLNFFPPRMQFESNPFFFFVLGFSDIELPFFFPLIL